MNARMALAFGLVVTLVVAGCQQAAPTPVPTAPAAKPAAPTAPPPATTRGGTLRVGLDGEVVTLDPHIGTPIAVDRHLNAAIYERLTGLDKNLNIVPELAVSWETPNNLTYVFKLRQGVKFHDGTDFNAQAVKFNVDRILEPANNSHQRSAFADVKSVEVVDQYTVKFNLSQPSPPLLAELADRAGNIVSPAAVQKHGKDFGRNPVGTGPFQFVEWLKDDHITVKRFAGYWDKDLPQVDQIIFRTILDRTVKLNELKTGNIDFVDNVDPKDVAGLRTMPDLTVSEMPGMGYKALYLNVTRAPFDNKALRQAASYAVNREAILKAIYFGLGSPGVGVISQSGWAYDPGLKGYTHDITRAKAKLAEGGKPSGFKFALSVYNNPLDIQHAQVIKAQMAEAGIEADLQVGERTKILADMRAKNHVSALTGWSGRADPDGEVAPHYHSKGSFNGWVGGYNNRQVDELLDKARASLKIEERKQLYNQVEKLLIDDAPAIFLSYPAVVEVKVMRRNVQGFVHIPDGIIRSKTIAVKQ